MRVLALDVGTSSVRAQLYDERAREVGAPARRTHAQRHEVDADDLVLACQGVLDEAGRGGFDALAISCFWHSLLLLDAHEQPLTPVLLWSDRRAAAQAEELAARLDPVALHARTGAFLHPSFWPAKLAWLGAKRLAEAAGIVSFADYLFLRLAGELRTTLSMASGSGLLDLRARRWDAELLGELGVDESKLPPIHDDPAGTIYPPLGDGACSNLGAGCIAADRAALMIGTSGAYRVLREGQPEPRDGLFSYFLDERRVVEGGAVSDGGNLQAWLERTLRLEDAEPREPDGHGLTFLPLLGGERSLGWSARAAGAIAGLTFDVDPADILQAGLEGVAYRLAEIADRLPGVQEVVATGGALLAEPGWIQLCADVLGRPVTASAVPEGSARGAAAYALERLGEAPEPAPLGETYEPDASRAEIYAAARERQRELYERLRGDDSPPRGV
jgi:gluconokinase